MSNNNNNNNNNNNLQEGLLDNNVNSDVCSNELINIIMIIIITVI